MLYNYVTVINDYVGCFFLNYSPWTWVQHRLYYYCDDVYVEQSDYVFMEHLGDFMKDVIYDGTLHVRALIRSPVLS